MNACFNRTDTTFSLCGLNCQLCPAYTRGNCCGCKAGSPCAQNCGIAPCSVAHGNLQYCFLCDEYPCEKYERFDQHDSIVLHRNIPKDVAKAKRMGLEAYGAEQREKKQLLDQLLAKYDDGQRDVFLCLAVNMLEVADLKELLAEAETGAETLSLPQRAAYMERQLHACAQKRGLVLELIVTDEPWFK